MFRFMNPARERNPERRDFCSGSKNEVPNILRLSGLNNARLAQEHFGTTVESNQLLAKLLDHVSTEYTG